MSPWGAPILFSKKPDGSLQFCIDYGALSKIMVKELFPLLQHKDLMDYLGSSKFFTLLDLLSIYWFYCIAEQNAPKMALLTQYRPYKWVVIPMGLINAPEKFM